MTTASGISIVGPQADRAVEILTPEALEFVALLHREFDDAQTAVAHLVGDGDLRQERDTESELDHLLRRVDVVQLHDAPRCDTRLEEHRVR